MANKRMLLLFLTTALTAGVVFSQKVDEIGPVIETQFGYHIIQVQDHIKAKTKTLDEVKQQITKTLTDQRKQTAVKKYINSLIKKATIVYGKN